MDTIFQIVILILSIVIHETSHGFMALRLGDYTAKIEGRLTLNPIKHIDPFGSIVVPILTSLGGLTFGWAKPVPYNPYNLKWKKWGESAVAFAGPLSNIIIAILFGLLVRISASFDLINNFSFYKITSFIIVINIVLAVFNMIPIPPLDGSKVIGPILPYNVQRWLMGLEQYGFILVLGFVIFFGDIISPIVMKLFGFITGIS